ncbi:hypothetical protein [Spirosoma montaniterrae]|uniref:Uncharacterized protein n=1 Tax=Spirosoma montaniterrae TaxID=1178516 RepID=A0A1P9WSE4_9BACT|nr:hypothetical protein [Spirosoma montaniterrae]AQG78306.1 hypothetical protein AWR27_02485 [Spirosoma montaniterrae]
MFTTLYELFLGQNNDPIYVDEIFTPVGTITLLVALILALVFYLGLGRWRSVFHRVPHWVITLVVLLIFAFAYAIWYALDRTGADDTDSYMTGFGGINALYAAIEFFVFSIALKRFSIFARRTPF